MVAGDAQHVGHAKGRGAQGVGLQRDAVAVARDQREDRLELFLHQQGRERQRAGADLLVVLRDDQRADGLGHGRHELFDGGSVSAQGRLAFRGDDQALRPQRLGELAFDFHWRRHTMLHIQRFRQAVTSGAEGLCPAP